MTPRSFLCVAVKITQSSKKHIFNNDLPKLFTTVSFECLSAQSLLTSSKPGPCNLTYRHRKKERESEKWVGGGGGRLPGWVCAQTKKERKQKSKQMYIFTL